MVVANSESSMLSECNTSCCSVHTCLVGAVNNRAAKSGNVGVPANATDSVVGVVSVVGATGVVGAAGVVRAAGVVGAAAAGKSPDSCLQQTSLTGLPAAAAMASSKSASVAIVISSPSSSRHWTLTLVEKNPSVCGGGLREYGMDQER